MTKETLTTTAQAIVLAILCMQSSGATAQTVTATLTADNHYGLFHAPAAPTGPQLAAGFVGRNELGDLGSSGGFNWSNPETWTFDMNLDDCLYVVAWDDASVQMWIGNFAGGPFGSLVSDATSWEFLVSANANPGASGNVPGANTLAAEIVNANANSLWNMVGFAQPYGAQPWGNIPGLGTPAQHIWADGFDNAASDDHYVIFRQKKAPEPPSLALVGIGVLCYLATRWRHCGPTSKSKSRLV